MFITYFWVDSWLKLMAACAEQMQPLAAEGDARTTLESELEQLRASFANMQAVLALMEQERGKLEADLELRQREMAAERAEQVRQLDDEKAAAEKRLRQEAAARAEAQADVQAVRGQLAAAEAEGATLGRKLATAETETKALREKLAAAEAAGNASREKLAAAEAAIESARSEARQLSEANASLQIKAEAAAGEAKSRIEQLRGETAAVRQELQAKAEEADKLRGENAQLEFARAARQSELEGLRAELEATREKAQADRSGLADTSRLGDAAQATEPVLAPAAPSDVRRPAKRARKAAAAADEPAAPAGLALRFHKPDGWGKPVYIHYWNTQPAVAEPAWPGTAMTDEGDGWWSHRIDGARSASLVFNDTAGNQTGNLSRQRSGRLDADGGWIDED